MNNYVFVRSVIPIRHEDVLERCFCMLIVRDRERTVKISIIRLFSFIVVFTFVVGITHLHFSWQSSMLREGF